MQHIRRAESAARSFHKTASEDAAQLRNPLQKKREKTCKHDQTCIFL